MLALLGEEIMIACIVIGIICFIVGMFIGAILIESRILLNSRYVDKVFLKLDDFYKKVEVIIKWLH